MKKKISYAVCAVMLVTQLMLPSSISAAVPKISKNAINLHIGQTYKLKVNGTKVAVKWTSNNKKIAAVNSSGTVTAKSVGKVTVTAKVGVKKLTCKVTVNDPSLGNLEKYLKDKKVLSGEKLDMSDGAYMIGAKNGFKYSVGEKRVEIYEYDINSTEYKEIKKTGVINIWGYEINVNAINGKFVLYCDVDNSQEVIKAFKQF